jgi:hypothetical protein
VHGAASGGGENTIIPVLHELTGLSALIEDRFGSLRSPDGGANDRTVSALGHATRAPALEPAHLHVPAETELRLRREDRYAGAGDSALEPGGPGDPGTASRQRVVRGIEHVATRLWNVVIGRPG